ncbi:MAG: MurR/RpiR family transcriptional regulator [Hespellia sp.]|nr:MurR/RpiR family transcriptional regulator [Hespellia sp.]
MKYYEKTIIPIIETHYENLSTSEKTIADFFINNQVLMDFSSKNISQYLFVSEASLSRFAKKCGFEGYREFIFLYKESFTPADRSVTYQMRTVFDAYQEILNKSYNLVVEAQLHRIVDEIARRQRVFVYGRGSSGLAAREMQLRFMRLGLDIDAIDDGDVMRMNASVINRKSMAIGISISGETTEILCSLKQAFNNGAYTVLITACNRSEYQDYCHEVVCVAARKNLNYGNLISPQFPVLVIADILYEYYQETDQKIKQAFHGNTLMALNHKEKQDE